MIVQTEYANNYRGRKRAQVQIISSALAKKQSLAGAGDFRDEASAEACVKEGDRSSGFAKPGRYLSDENHLSGLGSLQ